MKNPFDTFHKELLVEALAELGTAEPDHRIVSEPLSADVAFVPSPKPAPEVRRRLGLLGRMGALGPCLWEPHSTNPRVRDFVSALRKLWTATSSKSKDSEDQRESDGDGNGDEDVEDALVAERLWMISCGRPGTMLERYRCEPLAQWPRGFYRSTMEEGLHLVAVIELARRRDTLLLRLMGRGRTLLDALDDLQALPADAFESRLAMPLVLRWARHMNEAAAHELIRSHIEKEAIMRAREWLARERRQQRERGLEKGLEKGLELLGHLFERRLGRSLTADERATLRERLDELGPERVGDVVLDLSPEELAVWLAESASA